MHVPWFIVDIFPNYKLVLLQFRPLFIRLWTRWTTVQCLLGRKQRRQRQRSAMGSLHIDMQKHTIPFTKQDTAISIAS